MPDDFARTYRDDESSALTGEDIAMNDNTPGDQAAERHADDVRARPAQRVDRGGLPA